MQIAVFTLITLLVGFFSATALASQIALVGAAVINVITKLISKCEPFLKLQLETISQGGSHTSILCRNAAEFSVFKILMSNF